MGNIIVLRPWDSISEGVASLFLAILLGIILAYFTNSDSFHKQLRKIGFTTRTSHPSEWYYVFSEKVTFVILHLKDGRRLYGWPKEWPVEPGKGQFYIMGPSWILDDETEIELLKLDEFAKFGAENQVKSSSYSSASSRSSKASLASRSRTAS